MATETAEEQGQKDAAAKKAAKVDPPAPKAEHVAPAEAKPYTRERLLGPDGPQITGATVGEIAAALSVTGEPAFTLAEIQGRIVGYRGHEDTTGQES